ncbi:MAG: hypothetical protein M1814_004746 [Vezdaea aestivalis]|nr:MAG: hypothetical protein M1814_004746 [Vezdaea aestivalis]
MHDINQILAIVHPLSSLDKKHPLRVIPINLLLIRGEYGQDIIDELSPIPGEVVIDKPGKGAFWNTRLMEKLQARAITHLVVTGVTTECCFATTIREANDRGFECCGVVECTAGYNSCFKDSSLDMLQWSQGLFGFVAGIQPFVDILRPISRSQTVKMTTPPLTPPLWDGDLRISSLLASYRAGLSLVTMLDALYDRIKKYETADPAVWIHLESKENLLERARALELSFPDKSRLPPLYGVPFSVKDSIDIAGIATTTACPPLAFVPTTSAIVCDLLLAEGAIFVGKVNLDQLATGLNGTRSPYGITHSTFHPEYISGGSSSGSAVSVSASLVSFSVATDTAGSGRVPALFNGIIGFKPTRGTLSAQGLTPACASLDCIALMASNVEDTRLVWTVCEGYDEDYVYSKPSPPNLYHVNSIGPQSSSFRFGIPPPETLAICSPVYRQMFNKAVKALQSIGGVLTPTDWSPFEKAGNLLYDGSFVCERLASLPDGWLEANRDHLHPVILQIFEAVVERKSTAVDAYRDLQAKKL